MSHTIALTDEQYAMLEAAAAKGGESPEQLIGRILNTLTEVQGPVYYTDEELLRALGAGDEEIAELLH